MRSYLDIIIDLKEGKKPDYEEVRLACLMANDLLFFSERDLGRVIKPESNEFIKNLTRKNYESRFGIKKNSPEFYLGKHHPDNPENQRFMKIGDKILDRILKDGDIKTYKIIEANGDVDLTDITWEALRECLIETLASRHATHEDREEIEARLLELKSGEDYTVYFEDKEVFTVVRM